MTQKNHTPVIFTLVLFVALIGCTFNTVFAQDDFPPPPPSKASRVLDFDGDGASDLTVARDVVPGNLIWYIKLSSGSFIAQQFGVNNDWFVPEYYDSDNKADIAVWRQGDFTNQQGYFYILRSTNGTVQVIPWGLWLDTPEKTQDFDGDNLADPTTVRFPSGGKLTWYTILSITGQVRVSTFGTVATDGPIRGDFDGDGKADLAVRRCQGTQNSFVIRPSSGGLAYTVPFGLCGNPGDMSVAGDFDGDGKSDVATYRWSAAQWRYKSSASGFTIVKQFGIPQSDLPSPGDYDGDGRTDFAQFRQPGGSGAPAYFHVLGTTSGYVITQWGLGDDHSVAFELLTH
jgi:hypothetical protein